MQVIILATNEERRLPPLTDDMPAPLLPVVDKPVMESSVEILARAGHKHLLVSLFHQGGPIAAYFGSGKRWGMEIEYVIQHEGWGSAGALKWAAGLFKDSVLVLPGDAVLDLDIEVAFHYHRAHGGAATVILHQPREDSCAPAVQIAADNRVVGVSDGLVDAASALVATGAFIFEPRLLHYIPAGAGFDTINDWLPALLDANEAVFGYKLRGYWNPLASLRGYQEAQQVFLYSAYSQCTDDGDTATPVDQVRFPSLNGRQVAPGIWVGMNDSLHPSVKLAAPVYIGANSWIGREVELGGGTVIGSGVVIDEEATISSSTVLSETYVGRLVNVENRVVRAATMIDPATGDYTQIVDPFLLNRIGTPSGTPHRISQMFNALGAAVLLATLSPIVLTSWLLAWIGSGGHPIVRTSRIGRRLQGSDGLQKVHIFEQFRFHTRKPNGQYSLFGRLLERYEWHRLPELVNVLHGDMALVGVKPLTPGEEAQLTEDWHQKRHDAAPGFTGLWYLQTEHASTLDTVLVADVYYTATRTWHGDLHLLLRTPTIWGRRCVLPGSYRSDSAETVVHASSVERISHSETT